ncbi:MAG: preprotein translocase subunit SecE [Alphaproteobacteria bacterium]|nr:preprotein translocase subunit SecE [Alphaproteobacteria bacterium]
MARTSPIEFMRQVRQEASKVTWPTRKETTITTIMVFLMVFICAIFFLIVDHLLSLGVTLILGMGA